MTTRTVAVPSVPTAPDASTQAKWAVTDSLAVARRNLLKYLRVPTLLVFSTVQPVMFVVAFSWIMALIGLTAGNVEAAQASSFVWVFPFVFASTAFVPLQSMPGWLQAWAKVNPVSVVVDGIRSLTLGGRTATLVQGGSRITHIWQAIA